MASAGLDNVVRVWDVATRKQVAELAGHHRRVHFLTFSHSGKQLATAGMDRTIKLWNTPQLQAPESPRLSQGTGRGGGGGSVRSTCKPEVEKLCVGETRVGKCLRAHVDQLSSDRKAELGRDNR